jgi:hypothetical protein
MIEPLDLEGAKILIGITREHLSGEISQEQFVGIAHVEKGEEFWEVYIACEDGVIRDFPFDTRSLSKSPGGEFRLRNTGQIVKDPDYLMTWTITEGQPEE